MRQFLLLTLALTLAACDSGSDPASDGLGGTYRGTNTEGATITVAIPSTTSGEFTISSGTFSDEFGETPLRGTGTYTPPNIAITLESSDPNALFGTVLTGTVGDDGGRLTLVNEDQQSFTLTRQ